MMLSDALVAWREQIEEGLAAMVFFRRSQGDRPGADGSVSLVAWPREPDAPELVFVQWASGDQGVRGRVADVTDDNHLKCIVPVGRKKIPVDFATAGSEILIPQTGVRMVKDKQFAAMRSRANPNKIPDLLLHFMRMWRTAECMRRDQRAELSLGEACFVCKFGSGTDADGAQVEGGQEQEQNELSVCPFCLLTCHDVCASKLACEFAQQCDSFSFGASGASASNHSPTVAAHQLDKGLLAAFPPILKDFRRPGDKLADDTATCFQESVRYRFATNSVTVS